MKGWVRIPGHMQISAHDGGRLRLGGSRRRSVSNAITGSCWLSSGRQYLSFADRGVVPWRRVGHRTRRIQDGRGNSGVISQECATLLGGPSRHSVKMKIVTPDPWQSCRCSARHVRGERTQGRGGCPPGQAGAVGEVAERCARLTGLGWRSQVFVTRLQQGGEFRSEFYCVDCLCRSRRVGGSAST